MVSKDFDGIFVGRGMSRASKRAKEHQNRGSGELVMAETKFERKLKLQVTDVRKRSDVRGPDVRAGSEIRKFGSG